MILPSILDFLAQRIGLEAHSVGLPGIEAALQERMLALQMTDIGAYRDLLLANTEEQNALIEQVVVPETWFFRDQAPFDFLAVHARKQWGDFSPATPLRLLSLPCSTGEEPYSIAMTLLDAGNAPESFHIDAVDVSHEALHRARVARYSPHDFRGKNLDVLQRHFSEVTPDCFDLLPRVRDTVRFAHGTFQQFPFPEIPGSYHAIFCRNLLIYLNATWRKQAVELFRKLLRPDGILFIGHADAFSDLSAHFSMARNASAFAYYPKDAPPPAPSRRVNLPPTDSVATLVTPMTPIHKPPLSALLSEMKEAIERQDGETAHSIGQAALSHTRIHPELYYLLGEAHELRQDMAAAKDAWQKSLYLFPRHLNSLQRLKDLLEKEGDHTAAARLEARIRRVQSLQPEV
ncbi:MAG: hypothetical protein B9S32_02280 [Verrucomicrobia bacterium Tous-C9LFEB]|nr:MAG: hypothetical protein B9S32_02280 [Verrucomicrobia bacterium Tous-C9LFEB]